MIKTKEWDFGPWFWGLLVVLMMIGLVIDKTTRAEAQEPPVAEGKTTLGVTALKDGRWTILPHDGNPRGLICVMVAPPKDQGTTDLLCVPFGNLVSFGFPTEEDSKEDVAPDDTIEDDISEVCRLEPKRCVPI